MLSILRDVKMGERFQNILCFGGASFQPSLAHLFSPLLLPVPSPATPAVHFVDESEPEDLDSVLPVIRIAAQFVVSLPAFVVSPSRYALTSASAF